MVKVKECDLKRRQTANNLFNQYTMCLLQPKNICMVLYFAIGSLITYLMALGVAFRLDHLAKRRDKQKTYEASNCDQRVN